MQVYSRAWRERENGLQVFLVQTLTTHAAHSLHSRDMFFFSFYLSKNKKKKKKKKGGNEMSSSPGTQRRVSCQSLAAHLAIRIE